MNNLKRKILTICLTALICVFFVKISAANADEINPGTDSTSTNLTDASNNVLPENNANNNNADNNSENNANDKSDKKRK